MNETKETCKAIADLCQNSGSLDWAKTFYYFMDDVEQGEWSVIKRKILKVYGGMGSFNDLVLHKDNSPLGKENNELDKLRKKLYKEVTDNW